MSWPLASEALLAFAHGHDEILVIEEKAPMVENQIKAALFHAPGKRPRVTGKTDEDGRPLLPTIMEFDPLLVARALTARLADDPVGIATRLSRLEAVGRRSEVVALPARKPFFCSGCPHNSSTRTPEGSLSGRSEEHPSELQSLMRISYAVFCLKKKNK